jgi:hypothetical protein
VVVELVLLVPLGLHTLAVKAEDFQVVVAQDVVARQWQAEHQDQQAVRPAMIVVVAVMEEQLEL